MHVYPNNAPTEPGWYWCRNVCDRAPGQAEFICHVFEQRDSLCASWMTTPGRANLIFKENWSPDALWSNRMPTPTEADRSEKTINEEAIAQLHEWFGVGKAPKRIISAIHTLDSLVEMKNQIDELLGADTSISVAMLNIKEWKKCYSERSDAKPLVSELSQLAGRCIGTYVDGDQLEKLILSIKDPETGSQYFDNIIDLGSIKNTETTGLFIDHPFNSIVCLGFSDANYFAYFGVPVSATKSYLYRAVNLL